MNPGPMTARSRTIRAFQVLSENFIGNRRA
jgi:hypothetical protein